MSFFFFFIVFCFVFLFLFFTALGGKLCPFHQVRSWTSESFPEYSPSYHGECLEVLLKGHLTCWNADPHQVRPAFLVRDGPSVGVGVHPPPRGLLLTRPDTCYQEGRMKEQIFRVTGGVVWAPGKPFSQLDTHMARAGDGREIEGETGSQWVFCLPEVPQWHHGNCRRRLHAHSLPSSRCAVLFCALVPFHPIRSGNIFGHSGS